MKLFAFLKPLDIYLFQQLDLLKANSFYLQIIDRVSALNSSAQKITYQVASFSIIFLPLFITTLLLMANCSLRSDLDEKYLIKENIDLYLKNKNILNAMDNMMATQEIKSAEELTTKIESVLNGLKVSARNASVANFNTDESWGSITQVSADLNFSDFSMEDFAAFITALISEKINIHNLNINRNPANQTIKGDIHLVIFNRIQQYQYEEQ
ncbi:MAG: hypothetical protein A2504_07710 [Bdellovibrionales bacterium RIFOXYD12_FULL_39_22]|nr:MAG: hypothetical protein A2451_02380 [Bdellovibrionales bacterium RIFOXYC2_FULL_39_8]OFZ74450.1 MAG: hypothetical protein A2560_11365 [Bdellovibrionales bacterium RIFOXYD1_FULL_39_84]OFZ92462.1 MAG: hypothetical protein A2504_07710 [Bdellovibrionales bacterium RIFOXYD12_FULL_39_22]